MHHKITAAGLMKPDMTIWSGPRADRCLAEHWHVFIDDEAVTGSTD